MLETNFLRNFSQILWIPFAVRNYLFVNLPIIKRELVREAPPRRKFRTAILHSPNTLKLLFRVSKASGEVKRRRYEKGGLLQTWSSRRVPYKRVGLMEWRSILFVYLGSGALANTWSENFQLCKVRFNVGEAIFCALFLNCFHSSSIFFRSFFYTAQPTSSSDNSSKHF